MIAALALGFAALLTVAYFGYGRWVGRQLGLDDSRVTPAVEREDGHDFVPTRPFYLFAQHFSAIAAAGPIAGPILACLAYGWLPCLLWIGLGVVLIGAVHDVASLAVSVRSGASSIAEIARRELGSGAGRALIAFIWVALIYVIVAFTDITSASFVAGTEELHAGSRSFNAGGAVAAASVLYLGLSIVLGLVDRFLKPPLWLTTVIFVPLAFALSWAGTWLADYFVADQHTWGVVILVYCCAASITPVWALLQPRGYLGGFVLYAALAVGVIGVLFGGYEIRQPAYTGFAPAGAAGTLFPFLFVTIACGACSGFHGLVCSGTTSKQIARESHVHPIGYGAMLAEGFVALIALVTVMIAAPGDIKGLAPGTIYGQGIGRFLTLLVGEENYAFAVTFGAMAFSTFVFDTLDVSMRLGRYLLQELTGWKGRGGALFGTAATVAIPLVLALTAPPGSWTRFWTLFGASNQLLAALTLLAVSIWLKRRGRRLAFTLIPMLFVLAITLSALVQLVRLNLERSNGLDVGLINSLAAMALIVLAISFVVLALRRRADGPAADGLGPGDRPAASSAGPA
jgi:carbon starvation protein